MKMNSIGLLTVASLFGVGLALDFVPTNMLSPQFKTAPPAQANRVQYVETVYKATNHKTMYQTVEPLRPSYEVSYLSTSLTTVNNQTISTTSVEFATILNTTILYQSHLLNNDTYDVAPTHYQTLDFTSQRITYTPVTGNTSAAVTVTETNVLPFV